LFRLKNPKKTLVKLPSTSSGVTHLTVNTSSGVVESDTVSDEDYDDTDDSTTEDDIELHDESDSEIPQFVECVNYLNKTRYFHTRSCNKFIKLMKVKQYF
jgi:hypothetical protein